jgi:DNA-binding protein YbaB
MALDSEEMMRLAEERLSQTRERLAEMRAKVEETRITARSADNVITVVADGQGELVSITFNSAKWRRMAPAELGTALVKTINQAREDGRAELVRSYSGLMPEPLRPRGAAAGRVSLEEMFNGMLGRSRPDE